MLLFPKCYDKVIHGSKLNNLYRVGSMTLVALNLAYFLSKLKIWNYLKFFVLNVYTEKRSDFYPLI